MHLLSLGRKGASLLLWIVLATLSVNVARHAVTRDAPGSTVFATTPTRVAVFTPYTVVLRETVTSSTGRSGPGGVYTQALRSDGSFVLQSEYASNTKQVRQRLIHLSTGLRIDTNDIREEKSTIVESAPMRDPLSGCEKSYSRRPFLRRQVVEGEERVSGYRAVKITAGQTTQWFALDVGCAVLKAFSDQGAPASSEKSPEAIVPGEPTDALFDIPDRFREVAPSVLFNLRERLDAERFDSHYWASRPR